MSSWRPPSRKPKQAGPKAASRSAPYSFIREGSSAAAIIDASSAAVQSCTVKWTRWSTQAGCRHPERVHAYLDNLNRLGLIWFSKQPIDDSSSYQVLEAQPPVLEAVRSASRAKTTQRSIRLTPFGRDFCETCLPLEGSGQPVPAATDELGS